MTEKKEVIKKSYSIEVIVYDDNTVTVNRKNDGFSLTELLGTLAIAQNELLSLFSGNIKKQITETNRNSTDSPLIHEDKKAH